MSSTFADLVAVRNALQKRVFPLLDAFCEQYGTRFQPVDLRWGVSAEAGQDQRTMAICLDEIRRCQQTTPRPNYIVILGERYGWRPLPAEIPIEDLERIRASVWLREGPGAFERLYPTIDRNALPPVYCLRPRTADIETEWDGLEREVLRALEGAAREIGLPLAEQVKYGGSATEQEIVCGLLCDEVLPTAREHVHAFLLDIRDLPEDLRGKGFLDWTAGGLDTEARTRLLDVKQRLRATLGGNAHPYSISWNDAASAACPAGLCEDVYSALARTIAEEAGRFGQLDPLELEIEAHDVFAADRDRVFIGRAAVLRRVADYLAAGQPKPFALIGPSGSGKSAGMARALSGARKRHPEAAIAARFVGATAASSGGITLLDSLSRQVCAIYGAGAPPMYPDYPRMAAVFRERLKLARPERPLFLFVDALDQLPGSDFARNLSWLPLQELPPHVRLVVSASSDSRGPADLLEEKLDQEQRARLDPMPAEEAGQLLTLWLEDARRRLQPDQRESLIADFRASGLPLYLRFAFEQGRLWHSFDRPRALGSDVIQIIRQTFAWLSDPANHGDMLVARSLGYLTAAKEGLTEDEMVEVLSADSAVMSDFRSRFPKSPPADQLPMIIWSRLYYDLKPYLTERGGQGAAVLNYFHRQMREAAAAAYLDPGCEAERHLALARYFQPQPNVFGGQVFHTRKLSELPYQMRKSGMWEELEATLCDLAFIEAKCGAGLIYDLLADYDAAVLTAGLPSERKEGIASFGRFVRAQAHLLSTHPQLTFQQALNQPDGTAPARSAARLAETDARPRLRWINKPQQASPCALTLYGHTSYVNACDISPDCTRIASASSDEEIKIWDAASGKEELALRGRRISVESCQFSPDGRRIVSGTRDGHISMWDAASGGELWSVKAHERPIPSCRFSPDGRRIVSASWDGLVKVWDAGTGAGLLTLAGHTGDACWGEFSPDGAGIVSAGGDGKLKWWSAVTGEEIRSVAAHEHEIMTCRFSRDGASVFTASQDTRVKRWDAATFELRNTYEGHEEGVWAAAVSPDGTRLVSGARDGTIKLWDVESGSELAGMREHANEVWGLAFFDDGSRFVSASWDGTAKVWDLAAAEGEAAAGRPGPTAAPHPEEKRLWGYMIACCCAPDGAAYAAGSSDGSLRIWDAATGSPLGVFPIHRDFVFACAFSPDSRWIVSGSWDGAVKVFDVRERRETAAEAMPATVLFCAFTGDGKRVVACCSKEIRVWDFDHGSLSPHHVWKAEEPFAGCAVMPGGDQLISGLESGRFLLWDMTTGQTAGSMEGKPGLIMFSLSGDGRLGAATSEDTTVRIWDVEARAELMELRGHRERVVACNFSPDGKRLVTGSWDRTVRLWDLDAPSAATVLAGHTDQLQDVCFTPDGRRILSASVDGTVRLWDAQSGTALGGLLWPADSASACAFSPDGRYAATASHHHGIRIWSGASGQPERILSGHREAVRACVFSAQGQLLSASADGTLRLWDPGRGEAVWTLRGHRGPVEACAFSPDGTWIASAARDRSVKLWDAGTGAELATLEGHDDWVHLVTVIANGRWIVSGSLDRTVRIWDSATRRLLHVLRGHNAAISAVSAAPGGSRIVTGGEDGELHVWDAASGRHEAALSGHTAAIRACACAGAIASASDDGTLRLWDLETGHLRAELKGHGGPVQACAVSPHQRYLASGSEDQFVKIWDLATGKQLREYWAGAAARSLSWHPGGRRLAVGDAMGKLHLLELEGT